MSPDNERKMLQMLSEMKGMIEARHEASDKRLDGFDRDVENLWAHSAENRERVVRAETNIKGLTRAVFNTGLRAGGIAGGTAGTILVAIVLALHKLGVL
jgi:hypothetical protein